MEILLAIEIADNLGLLVSVQLENECFLGAGPVGHLNAIFEDRDLTAIVEADRASTVGLVFREPRRWRLIDFAVATFEGNAELAGLIPTVRDVVLMGISIEHKKGRPLRAPFARDTAKIELDKRCHEVDDDQAKGHHGPAEATVGYGVNFDKLLAELGAFH